MQHVLPLSLIIVTLWNVAQSVSDDGTGNARMDRMMRAEMDSAPQTSNSEVTSEPLSEVLLSADGRVRPMVQQMSTETQAEQQEATRKKASHVKPTTSAKSLMQNASSQHGTHVPISDGIFRSSELSIGKSAEMVRSSDEEDAGEADESDDSDDSEASTTDDDDQSLLKESSEIDDEDSEDNPNSDIVGLLKPAPQHDVPEAQEQESDVNAAVAGVGSGTYARPLTGRLHLDHTLMRRLQMQDLSTLILMLGVLGLTVIVSCLSVYQGADDGSSATYYCDPTYHHPRLVCECTDSGAFLQAFNVQPHSVRLRIVGRVPEPSVFTGWMGQLRRKVHFLPMFTRGRMNNALVLFDVSLDLLSFVTGEGSVDEKDIAVLEAYLKNPNKLQMLALKKEVTWACWEDVATNIRQRLRNLGFWGDVEVYFEATEELVIYPNDQWCNFVRNRITQVLVVLSVVGIIFWIPYVMIRQRKTTVKSKFQINLDPARYWELLNEGLNGIEGFQTS